MNAIIRRLAPLMTALVMGLGSAASQASEMTQLTLTIDPSLTYLHTYNDMRAGSATVIDLLAAGLHEGDLLLLERFGSFSYHGTGGTDDVATGMAGVFSSTNTLLDATNLNRVTGAIDAGTDVTTSVSYYGGYASNIAEDFSISSTWIRIPTGARFLFVAATDSYWGDNTDPNGDFKVRITAVPEPTESALFAAGLVALGATGWRRRRSGSK